MCELHARWGATLYLIGFSETCHVGEDLWANGSD